MKLEDMQVLEKVAVLEALIAKADLDVGYSTQVKWQEDQLASKSAASVIIDNAKKLFQSGEIDTLDEDVRSGAYALYSAELDKFLRMFPEYQLNDIVTESVVKQHM